MTIMDDFVGAQKYKMRYDKYRRHPNGKDGYLPTRREVLLMIAADAEADALTLDGKKFNGRTVAEQFGYLGAQIHALANIVLKLLPEDEL